MFQWIPEVKTRGALDPNWAKIPMSGMGPAPIPSTMPAVRPFIAYDRQNDRLLVTSYRPGMIAGTPVMVPTLFEASLQTTAWKFLGDISKTIVAMRPFATDPGYPQVFEQAYPLGLLSLAKGNELKSLPFSTSGELPPVANLTAAVRLPDGRILASASNVLLLFDEKARAWSAVRGVSLPLEVSSGHSLTLDAANDRVLLYGGQRGGVGSNKLFAIALETFAVTPLTTMGTATVGRWDHSAILIHGQLIIAAGTTTGTTAISDVSALDVATMTWRKLGDVPARAKAAVIARDNEVWVIGGSKVATSAGEPTIAALDVTTGALRTIAVQGTWPTRQGWFWAWAATGDGLIAIDSGDTNDYSKNQLWELTVTNGVAQWRNSDPDAMDDSLNGTIGVAASGCEGALFLGTSTFRVRR